MSETKQEQKQETDAKQEQEKPITGWLYKAKGKVKVL